MGYNTSIVICNDSLHDIEQDPNFGKKLVTAIRRQFSVQKPLVFGPSGTVIGQAHMDNHFSVLVGDNTGKIITSPANALIGFIKFCNTVPVNTTKTYLDPSKRDTLAKYLELLLQSNYIPKYSKANNQGF